MITIPKNTYEVSNECREEVVQMIVDAFVHTLNEIHFATIHIEREVFVVEYENFSGKHLGFNTSKYLGSDIKCLKAIRMRSCEVKEAVRMMIDAGYYFYESRSGCRKQCLYIYCSKRIKEPRTLEWWEKRITSFDYIID